MKKIEKRAVVCLLLALVLLLGLGLFCVRFVSSGGRWAGFAANRDVYKRQAQDALPLQCGEDPVGVGQGGEKFMEEGAGEHHLHAIDLTQLGSQVVSLGVALIAHLSQTDGAHLGQIDRSGQRAQRLIGADVGAGLLTTDMLLAGLHGEHEGALSLVVRGLAHDTARCV